MKEIRDNKIQKVENPKKLNIITIKESNFIEFVGYDKKGYKVSYNYLKNCYVKNLY